MPAPALPPTGAFIDSVRMTCEKARQSANVRVHENTVDAFLERLGEADYSRLKGSHGLAGMPLNFASAIDELNVVSVLSLMNFLHCYRIELHERTGRGAWQTIRYFVMSSYLASESPSLLSAAGMEAATVPQVAEAMAMPLHREKPHGSLPVQIGEVDPASEEIAGKLVQVLNSTGEALRRGGYESLGQFAAEALRDGKGSAELLVERVVRAFPAFQDMYTIHGETVYLFKKALFLVQAVAHTFSRPGASAPFPIPDASTLPIFSDNVIPTMMVHFGLLDLTESTDPILAKGLLPAPVSGPAATGRDGQHLFPGADLPAPSAGAIRASAVAGVEIVVKRAHELAQADSRRAWLAGVDAVGLDAYLWAVAKDTKEMRGIPRLTERGTVMY